MACFLVGTESRTTLSFSTLDFFSLFFFTCVHSSILSGSHVETFQVSSHKCELNKKKRNKREKKMWCEKMSKIFICFTKTPGADAGLVGSSWSPKSMSVDSQLSVRLTHWSEICTNTQASNVHNVVLKQWKDIKLWWILKGLRQE